MNPEKWIFLQYTICFVNNEIDLSEPNSVFSESAAECVDPAFPFKIIRLLRDSGDGRQSSESFFDVIKDSANTELNKLAIIFCCSIEQCTSNESISGYSDAANAYFTIASITSLNEILFVLEINKISYKV